MEQQVVMQGGSPAAYDAFSTMDELAPKVEVVIPEDRRERYFFFAGDEPGRANPGGLAVSTPCVPHKILRRCQVTPCVTVQQPARIPEIPEGRLIQGTQNFSHEIAHNGFFRMVVREGFAKQWLYAGPEAEMLLYQYGNKGNPDQSWGLVEVAEAYLRGRSWQDIRNLHLTEAFFPMWPDVPKTNSEVLEVLQQRIKEVPKEIDRSKQWVATDGSLVKLLDVYMQVAVDMEWAIIAAQEFQSEMVSRANLAVTLPSTEPGYKRKFDPRDELFSKRTGVELAMNSLRQNAMGPLEKLADRLSEKLQPQVAPQLDPAQFAMMATAMVQALKAEGMLVSPEAETKPAKGK
jgi:hypothetical protein